MHPGLRLTAAFLSAFALAALVGASCGVPTLTCGESCQGCCDPSGLCLVGTANAACGVQGVVCAKCTPDTECQQGHCQYTGFLTDGGKPSRRVELALPIPKIFWVLDRTGSTAFPLEGMSTTCTGSDGGACTPDGACSPACPSRFTGIKTTLTTLMTSASNVAQHASAMFPTSNSAIADGGCRYPFPDFVIPDAGTVTPAELGATASQVIFRFVDGGIPTSSSNIAIGLGHLNDVLSPSVETSAVLVVMVTDGLPNCNEQNPLSCAAPATCGCAESLGVCPSAGTTSCASTCVDADSFSNAVSAVSRAGVVPVMLVGVGASMGTALAKTTFNTAAALSGVTRTCAVDTDCGTGDICDTQTKRCGTQYFRVSTLAGVTAVKKSFDALFDDLRKCTVLLDADAAAASSFAVALNGAPVAPGTDGWTRAQPRLIRFNGAACATLKTKGLTALTVDQAQ